VKPISQRPLWVVLALCSLALLIYSAYRAAIFSLTIDESLSFSIFTWSSYWGMTANNHLLNTFLMYLCYTLFGAAEWALRLPNVLAFALYLVSGLLVIKRLKNPWLQVSAFLILNLDPSLLDFFSFARGYGLACAFQLFSVYLLIRAFEHKLNHNSKVFLFFIGLASVATGLAVLANFAWLNFYLPFLLACLGLILSDETCRKISFRHYRIAIIFFIAHSGYTAFVLYKLFKLKELGELYAGGSTGFIQDTIIGMINDTFYKKGVSSEVVQTIVVLIIVCFFLIVFFTLFQFFKHRKITLLSILVLMLVLAAFIPWLEHVLAGILYPEARGGLAYFLLFFLPLLFFIREIGILLPGKKFQGVINIFPVLVGIILVWNFFRNYDLDYHYYWYYDIHNTQVLNFINQDRQNYFPDQQIQLGISWQIGPSLNFYRYTKGYTWLNEQNREPINPATNDYIYAFEWDLTDLNLDNFIILKTYPDTETVLLRLNKSADSVQPEGP
jgi:hypothetical protein